mmetsp:Transcript_58600/g.104214  ORF Transcript_58600/g.104214 Transcript_58600/m.104214 type:complete len:91 (-) Transcript_58600:30-302(-)
MAATHGEGSWTFCENIIQAATGTVEEYGVFSIKGTSHPSGIKALLGAFAAVAAVGGMAMVALKLSRQLNSVGHMSIAGEDLEQELSVINE